MELRIKALRRLAERLAVFALFAAVWSMKWATALLYVLFAPQESFARLDGRRILHVLDLPARAFDGSERNRSLN